VAAHHETAPTPGSEVLAINGQPIAEVIDILGRRIPRDWDLASGMTLRLPLFDFTVASGAPPHPSGAFPPDLEVQPSAAALLRGEDPVLDAAAALARAEGQAGGPFSRRLTEYFDGLAANRDFQGVVLVRSAKQVLYARPFGFRDLATSRAHDVESRFGIASLTKTFTAAAILRLRDRGVLAITDPVSKFLPGFPNGANITLLQLLRHEAGLRDAPESPPEDTVSVPTSAALVAAIAAEPPVFPPGTSDGYSNAGYTILARVVEVASGLDFDRFLRDEFWDPLGMLETGDRRALTTEAGLARPYFPGPPPAWLDPLPAKQALAALGSGSLYSTAGDLGRWGAAVAGAGLSGLAAEPYPYGWGRTAVEGRVGVRQTGLTTGYASSLQVYSEADRIIVILSNVEHGAWTDWAQDAARIVFGAEDVTTVRRRAGTSIVIDSLAARRYSGRYRMNDARFIDISYEDGHLWLRLNGYHRRHYMLPTSNREFAFRSFSGIVRFEPSGSSDPAPGFTWVLPSSWDQPNEIYRRVPSAR
jgi:CubicO group peptidase (beta-lactamase class C family)